jgi:hypothetical protein
MRIIKKLETRKA